MRVPQHVVLVEDHPIFAKALEAMLLDAFPGVSVHQCATLAEGGRVLGGLAKPALVLFDINLPDSAGSDGILRLRALSPASTFIILSAETNPLKIRRVQTNGAIGVIPKSIPAEDLPQTILGLLQLQKPDAPRSVATAGPVPQGITARQQEVLRELARGASNKEIAKSLGLTPETVKSHVSMIFERLKVRNRFEAIRIFLEMREAGVTGPQDADPS